MSAMSCVKDEIIYDSEQDVNIGLSSEKVIFHFYHFIITSCNKRLHLCNGLP